VCSVLTNTFLLNTYSGINLDKGHVAKMSFRNITLSQTMHALRFRRVYTTHTTHTIYIDDR